MYNKDTDELNDRTPVLVGVGRLTLHPDTEPSGVLNKSPLSLLRRVATMCAADACPQFNEVDVDEMLAELDAITVLKPMVDTRTRIIGAPELYANLPKSLADWLNASKAETRMTHDGGNMPQCLLNEFATRIFNGEIDSALVVGADPLYTFDSTIKSGKYVLPSKQKKDKNQNDSTAKPNTPVLPWGWGEDLCVPVARDSKVTHANKEDFGLNDLTMIAHGVGVPRFTYPLFEEALRHAQGSTKEEHLKNISQLFARFSHVATEPQNLAHSWIQAPYTWQEIANATKGNRIVSTPYTKRMNAMDRVDQAAGVLMMSVAEAKKRGVPRAQWVFLHGCGDTMDYSNLCARPDITRSPPIAEAARQAFAMSGGLSVADIKHADIYSCFPVAVEIAAKEIGLQVDGPLELTVTGGLPYHGGPGNNYVSHSIAAMCERLRTKGRGEVGMVTANGGLLTKHSVGLYSTSPPPWAKVGQSGWNRIDPTLYQKQLKREHPPREVADAPEGEGEVESYTIGYQPRKAPRVILIGTMVSGKDKGKRFFANTKAGDQNAVDWFLAQDRFGARGFVETFKKGRFRFTPAELKDTTAAQQTAQAKL